MIEFHKSKRTNATQETMPLDVVPTSPTVTEADRTRGAADVQRMRFSADRARRIAATLVPLPATPLQMYTAFVEARAAIDPEVETAAIQEGHGVSIVPPEGPANTIIAEPPTQPESTIAPIPTPTPEIDIFDPEVFVKEGIL